MSDSNKKNLLFFESGSMRGLYDCMERWQNENQKRLLSTNIQKDGDSFCCIALSNPTEVVICDGSGPNQVSVGRGCLEVNVIYSDN